MDNERIIGTIVIFALALIVFSLRNRRPDPAKKYPRRNLELETAARVQRYYLKNNVLPWAQLRLKRVSKSFLQQLLALKTAVDLSNLLQEELGRQFANLSSRQTQLLGFYVLVDIIELLPPHFAPPHSEEKDPDALTQTDLRKLQKLMEKKSQLESMISNAMKAGFDDAQAELQALKES